MARNANELSVQPGEVLEVRMTLCEEVEEDGEWGRTGLTSTPCGRQKKRKHDYSSHSVLKV